MFIVANGGESIQLGDIKVKAVESRKMRDYLQEKYDHALGLVERRKPLIDSLEGVRTKLERRNKKLEKLRGEDTPIGTDPNKLYALPDAPLFKTPYGETITVIEPGTELKPISREGTNYKISYKDKTGYVLDVSVVSGERYSGPLGNTLNRYSEALDRCKNIRDSLMSPLVSTSTDKGFRVSWVVDGFPRNYYFQGIPKPKDTTRTDSEGNFELTLEQGVSYHIIARATLSVGRSRENYHWMVEMTPQGESEEIILSNSNVNETLPDSLDPITNSSIDVERLNHKICGASY